MTVLSGTGVPSAQILGPPPGTFVGPGTMLAFQGVGTDPEDGTLPGTSLQWSSDIDGTLGTGNTLQRVLSGPITPCNPESVGHTITLRVTDSDGQAGVTAFIREHNRMVAEDTRYVGSIVPIRDGVMTALRIA